MDGLCICASLNDDRYMPYPNCILMCVRERRIIFQSNRYRYTLRTSTKYCIHYLHRFHQLIFLRSKYILRNNNNNNSSNITYVQFATDCIRHHRALLCATNTHMENSTTKVDIVKSNNVIWQWADDVTV